MKSECVLLAQQAYVCVIAQRYADYALKQLANDIIKLPTGRSNYFKCPPRGQANELKKGGAAANMPAGISMRLADQHSGYLPLVSTFCFSSSFIFFTMGSRLASPVV